MQNELYNAIVAYHNEDIEPAKQYVQDNYAVSKKATSKSAWSSQDRFRREWSRFIDRANKYYLLDEELNRESDDFTVVKESDVADVLSSIFEEVYGGRDVMFYEVKKRKYAISSRRLTQWLKGDTVHAQYIPPKHEAVTNPIVSKYPNQRWQIDVTYLKSAYDSSTAGHTVEDFVQLNDGFQYILTIVDHFTKRVWLTALRRQTTEVITTALHQAIRSEVSEGREPPKLIQADNARVLTNAIERMTKYYPVKRVTSSAYSSRSQGLVERTHREVKRLLSMLMTEHSTKVWTLFIPTVEDIINNRYQSTIRMAPNEAINKTSKAADRIQSSAERMKKKQGPRSKAYNKGDRVRLAMSAVYEYLRKDSRKLGQPVWTEQIFKIANKRGYSYQLVTEQGGAFLNKDGSFAWVKHSEVMRV